jgi:hypothetical protein
MRKLCLLFIFVSVLSNKPAAQSIELATDSLTKSKSPFVVYINNPLGLFNKVRLKGEYRLKRNHSFLFSYTYYYPLTEDWEGPQLYLEYRKYLSLSNNFDFLLYGKSGIGWFRTPDFYVGGYNNSRGDYIKHRRESIPSPTYRLVGLGIGQQLWLNKSKTFNIEFTEGLQVIFSNDNVVDWTWPSFLLYGPGSFFNININLGYRF